MKLVNRVFEDLQPGDSAELHRLVTLDDLYVFAASSGNYNPLHLPKEDGDGDGRPESMAPGMFVASLISAVLGTHLPGPGTLYRNQSLQFQNRAHAGDELVCRVTVTEKLDDGGIRLATEVHRAADDAVIVTGTAEVTAPKKRFAKENLDVPGLVVQRHRHFEAILETAKPLPPIVTAVVSPEEKKSLGGAMLRNVESFWCPIRFDSTKKCENCKVDYPDINGGWAPAAGTMADVVAALDKHYPGPNNTNPWFGHPVRLTVEREPAQEAPNEPAGS